MPNTKSIGIAYEDQQLDGAVMGKSGGTAGFFGTTPVSRPTSPGTVDFSALTTSPVGSLTTAQISALQVSVNGIIANLKTLGLTA